EVESPHIWLTFTTEPAQLLVSSEDRVWRWDLAENQSLDLLPGKHQLLWPGRGHVDSPLLYDADARVLKSWDSGSRAFRPRGRRMDSPKGIAVSGDGSTLALVTVEGVLLIDTATGQERALLPQTGVESLAISSDARSVVTSDRQGLRWWDVASGQDY